MIVSRGLPYQSPVSNAKRAEEPKNEPQANERTDKTTPAQFAALMALLAGAGPKVRADLLNQVPAADSSLLDKLLAGTAPTADANVATAADAARYGMLLGNSTTDLAGILAGLPAPIGGTAIGGTAIGGAAIGGAATSPRISPEVLARIASRKSGSVEDLLALGDRDAAAAKTKLEALLATAGTPDASAIAAANALATALAASAADTATPIKSTDGLDPEFRARLENVIQRMQDEFGSDVTVVETVRSQDRQDNLFAQGRTAPGDIVTWTQDSAHTSGKAADVIVDGSWKNAEGFARLQQIAKDEGLRTLGARDPGHLELAKDSGAANGQNFAAVNVKPMPQMSGVARVASVASVAQVASAGNMPVGNMQLAPEKPAAPAAPVNASLGVMAQATRGSSDSRAASQDTNGEKSQRERPSELARTNADQSAVPGEFNKPTTHKFIGPVDAAERPAGPSAADGAQRVQDINELREQQPSSMSKITLEVDGPNGDTQHITVDMRGNTVGTNITTDPASADRMRAHVGDLQGALEGHGLEVDSVRISSPTRANDAVEQVKQVAPGDALRVGNSAGAGAGDGNLQQGQRERSSATRDWEDRQAAREDQRRSSKQQQDRQRPQYQEKQ